jgi:hypothetical protein
MRNSARYTTYVAGMGLVLCLIGSVATGGEVKWANTGHMTVDGLLESGVHIQAYGLDVEFLHIDANSSYVYALLALVSNLQKGEISPGQKRWFYERAIMSAVPRNIIEEYMKFEHRSAKLADYMAGSGGDSIARVLLYDVIQMITYGDQYNGKPRQRREYRQLFGQAARQLGMPGYVFAQIQRIVDEEVSLLGRKKAVFWGDTPYTPPGQAEPTVGTTEAGADDGGRLANICSCGRVEDGWTCPRICECDCD